MDNTRKSHKKSTLSLLILALCCLLCRCCTGMKILQGNTALPMETIAQPTKKEVAEDLGNYLFQALEDRKVTQDVYITQNGVTNIKYGKVLPEDLQNDFSEYFSWAVFYDAHTVLIYEGAFSQVGYGYLVTDRKEYEEGDLHVGEGYGFDAGMIDVRKTNFSNIYHYRAGL